MLFSKTHFTSLIQQWQRPIIRSVFIVDTSYLTMIIGPQIKIAKQSCEYRKWKLKKSPHNLAIFLSTKPANWRGDTEAQRLPQKRGTLLGRLDLSAEETSSRFWGPVVEPRNWGVIVSPIVHHGCLNESTRRGKDGVEGGGGRELTPKRDSVLHSCLHACGADYQT